MPIDITTSPDGGLNHCLLAFGQNLSGELYVLTSDSVGPPGTTGQVYRLVWSAGP